MPNYLSINEISKIWGISPRRVSTLAKQGRIPNAKLVGHSWLIPSTSEKPKDNRYTLNKEYINNTSNREDNFIFPLLVYSKYNDPSFVASLNDEEIKMLEAEKIFISNHMDISYPTFLELYNTSNNEFIKIGALFYLSFTELLRSNFSKFDFFYNSLKVMVETRIDKYPFLQLILNDINCIIKGDIHLAYISNINFIAMKDEDETKYPYIFCYLFKENALKMLSGFGNRDLSFYEIIASNIEKHGHVYIAQYLHILLAIMYKIKGDNDNKLDHVRKAIKIMYENNIYSTICEVGFFLSDSLDIVFKEYPSVVEETIKEGTRLYISSINKIAIHYNGNDIPTLNQLDYKYIAYALNGVANKEIAILLHISESAVSKKYKSICDKFLVDSKEELASKYLKSIFNPYLIVDI